MQKFLSDLPIRQKIVLCLVVPFLGFVVCCGLLIVERWRVAQEAADVVRIAQTAVKVSAAVHELQKERGMSSVFLNSHGARFRQELEEQRKQSDAKIEELRARMSEAGWASDAQLQKALAALGGLDGLRQQINGLQVGAPVSFAGYTGMIGNWLDWIDVTSQHIESPQLSRQMRAYEAFLRYKESLGQERATLAGILTAGQFDAAGMEKFFAILARKQGFQDRFDRLADEQERGLLQTANGSENAVQIRAAEQDASAHLLTGGFASNPADWFKVATAQINTLHEAEIKIDDRILSESASVEARVRAMLLLLCGFALLSAALAWWQMHAISQAMVQRLCAAVDQAASIEEGNLFCSSLDGSAHDEIAHAHPSVPLLTPQWAASRTVK